MVNLYMDLYVKINNIKNCKLSNDLSIPFGLYYNKNVKRQQTEIPIICSKGGLICEKVFDKFLDDESGMDSNTKSSREKGGHAKKTKKRKIKSPSKTSVNETTGKRSTKKK